MTHKQTHINKLIECNKQNDLINRISPIIKKYFDPFLGKKIRTAKQDKRKDFAIACDNAIKEIALNRAYIHINGTFLELNYFEDDNRKSILLPYKETYKDGFLIEDTRKMNEVNYDIELISKKYDQVYELIKELKPILKDAKLYAIDIDSIFYEV